MNKETPKGWKQYRLNDLFIINPPKDNISNDTEVSFIAMKDVSDAGYLISSEVKRFEEVKNGYTYFKNDDVILAKITPCFENGKMAVLLNLTNNYGVGSTEFYVFRKRPNANILPQILYYIFKEPSFRKNAIMHMSGAAGQKRVQRKFLEYYPLSIPLTTAEQQEIVQVLDTMNDIIRLRKECISHAQDLIPALFQEMFGNPLTNDKNLPIVRIDTVTKVVSGGTPSTQNSEYWDGDIIWLTPKDLSGYNSMYISKGERNITDLGYKKSSAQMMPKGSVLFTSRAPIGYVAIADTDLCTNQGFKSFIPTEAIKSEYLYQLLKMSKEKIINMSSGATFKEISGGRIKELKIPLPPIELQEQFAEKVRGINSYIKEQRDELENAKQMFQSLLHHAFTGELTRRAYGKN